MRRLRFAIVVLSLPNSNGKVGLQGGSYLGINQLSTADTPHLVPTLTQLPHLLLGIYQVKSGSVTIPMAAPTDFPPYTCTFCK